MNTLSVPTAVLANVRTRWPDVADLWAAQVEDELHLLFHSYRATLLGVLPARYGFVVAADTPYGQLVFRSSPDPAGHHQAAVAVALADLDIAPTVHHVAITEHGTWTVLERAIPGTDLSEADPTRLSLEALFAPLARMNGQRSPDADMPSLIDWLQHRLEDDDLTDVRPGTSVASWRERQNAMELLAELKADHQPALCHGDVSRRNVILSDRRGWMLIDPRGVAGETAYDVAVLTIRRSTGRAAGRIIRHICGIAGVDLERVKAWMAIAEAARV